MARPTLFVCWAPVIQRCEGLGRVIPARVLAPTSVLPRRPWTAPFRYLELAVRTLAALVRARPAGLLVMLPPLPLLVLCWAYARLRRIPVVLDLHSAVFEYRKWTWALPATVWLARRSALTIVSNESYLERLEDARVRAVILHEVFEPMSDAERADDSEGYVLVPASWHDDEPIGEIITAAEAVPSAEFRITGRPPDRWATTSLPVNVQLTGYLPDVEYQTAVARAGVVLSLTTNDNTMQAGGYQALTWRRPLVTSDSRALRSFFGDAAVYCEPTAASIAAAVREAVMARTVMTRRMAELGERLAAEYPAQLAPVREALGIHR